MTDTRKENTSSASLNHTPSSSNPPTSTPTNSGRNRPVLNESAVVLSDENAATVDGHEEDDPDMLPLLPDEPGATTMNFVVSQQTDGSSILLPAPSEQIMDPLLKYGGAKPSFSDFLKKAEKQKIDDQRKDDEDYILSSSESSEEY